MNVDLAPVYDPPISTVGCIKLGFHDKYKQTCEVISNSLNLKEKEFFIKETQFGPLLLGAPDFYRSNMIMYYLHLRQVRRDNMDELWMVVNGQPLRFSLFEYALITGLNCRSQSREITPFSTVFCVRHFQKEGGVTVPELVEKLVSMESLETGNLEKVKLAALYFVASVILPVWKHTSHVDPQWLTLVEDFRAFNKFPWGTVSYEFLVSCLYNDFDFSEKKDHRSRKNTRVGGFIVPLQFLAYECISAISKNFATPKVAVDLPLPRICRWVTNPWKLNHPPKYEDVISTVGESKEITCLMIPTSDELKSDYVPHSHSSSSSYPVTADIYNLVKRGVQVFCRVSTAIEPAVPEAAESRAKIKDQRSKKIDSQFGKLRKGIEDQRSKKMDRQFGKLTKRMEQISKKMNSKFRELKKGIDPNSKKFDCMDRLDRDFRKFKIYVEERFDNTCNTCRDVEQMKKEIEWLKKQISSPTVSSKQRANRAETSRRTSPAESGNRKRRVGDDTQAETAKGKGNGKEKEKEKGKEIAFRDGYTVSYHPSSTTAIPFHFEPATRDKQNQLKQKHRPKVVREGKLKKTPKPPATPKTNSPDGNSTGKRKYVRKNKTNMPNSKSTPEVKKLGPEVEIVGSTNLNLEAHNMDDLGHNIARRIREIFDN